MRNALRYMGLTAVLVTAAVLLLAAQAERSLQRNLASLAEARLRLVLTSTVGTIQANLDFGLPLASLRQIQELVERTLAKQPGLRAIDVIDEEATALFSSDRGAEGEQAPAAWLAAMAERRDTTLWRAEDRGEMAYGLPIVSDIGRTVGHLVVVEPAADNWTGLGEIASTLTRSLPLALGAGALTALLVGWLAGRHQKRLAGLMLAFEPTAPSPPGPFAAVARRAAMTAGEAQRALAAAQAELERIDHEQ